MPMFNRGSVPQSKKSKKANQEQNKKDQRDLKGIVAKENEKGTKYKRDPRDN